jgi:hypothetical protein
LKTLKNLGPTTAPEGQMTRGTPFMALAGYVPTGYDPVM